MRTKIQRGCGMRARDSRCKRACLVARTALAVCFGATVAGVAAARAEPTFPSKPIHISVPYGAGGVADLTMRLLAQKLTERTKQQVALENRPGAGGLLSAKAVLEASADGYTLGVIGNGQAIGMSLFKARPYNVLSDFTLVSMTASFEMLLAVKADSALKTLQDVVAAARKNPKQLNFGAINPGSTQNLSAHLLKQVSGADVTIIPYKTTPDLNAKATSRRARPRWRHSPRAGGARTSGARLASPSGCEASRNRQNFPVIYSSPVRWSSRSTT